MKLFKFFALILMITIGVTMFILAEYDNSPGGQLLGVIVAITSIIYYFKRRNK